MRPETIALEAEYDAPGGSCGLNEKRFVRARIFSSKFRELYAEIIFGYFGVGRVLDFRVLHHSVGEILLRGINMDFTAVKSCLVGSPWVVG